MPSLNHIHTYVRIKGTQTYQCGDPKCTHSSHRKFLKGKSSVCPQCGTVFLLTWELLRRAIPLCLNCSSTKEAKQHQKLKSLMESLISQGD